MSFRTERPTRITNEVFRFSDLALEIQLLIFGQFDRPSLHSAVQVNKRWYDWSVTQLWREPSMSRVRKLASLQPLQRRQYYASKIRHLSIDQLSITHTFDNLVFSSLESLWLEDGLDGLDGPDITVNLAPFLQSRIRTLSFRDCWLRSRCLKLIASCCPSLRKLSICSLLLDVDDMEFASFIQSLSCLQVLVMGRIFDFLTGAATAMFETNMETLAPKLKVLGLVDLMGFPDPEPFHMFLMNCKSLETLVIHSDAELRLPNLMTDSVLSHVMNANPLQHLHGDWLDPDLLEQVVLASKSVQPFGALRSLNVWGGSSSALFILLQASSRFQVLKLDLDDINTELFFPIGTQKQLRHLTINPPCTFSITHLSILSSLVSLVYLEITCPRIRGLNDSTFSQLLSGFLHLKTFILDLDRSHLGAASIKSLSQACPLLERCALIYCHDLSTWVQLQTDASPLFPNLVSLHLGEVAEFAWGGSFDVGSSLDTRTASTGDDLSITKRARVCANMLLGYIPSLETFGIKTVGVSAIALQNVLVQMKPCKRLGADDVAEVPIITVQGMFSSNDFSSYDQMMR